MRNCVACWIAVSGYKNAGKTTLLERLIRALAARGRRVGALKRDAHGFASFPAGTDTARLAAAGAERTAILGPDGHLGWDARLRPEERARVCAETVLAPLDALDFAFLEGGKEAPLGKFVLLTQVDAAADGYDPPLFARAPEARRRVLAWVVPAGPRAVNGGGAVPVFFRDEVDGMAAELFRLQAAGQVPAPDLAALAAYLAADGPPGADGA